MLGWGTADSIGFGEHEGDERKLLERLLLSADLVASISVAYMFWVPDGPGRSIRLPFPGRLFSDSQSLAPSEEGVEVYLPNCLVGAVEQSLVQDSEIRVAGEEGYHDNGVYRMRTRLLRDPEQHGSEMAVIPARMTDRVRPSRALEAGLQETKHSWLCTSVDKAERSWGRVSEGR